MTKSQGYWCMALLAALLVIAVHVGYIRKRALPKYEYRATEGEKVDLGSLQSAGTDGWDCAVVPAFEGTAHHYIVLCKRPLL